MPGRWYGPIEYNCGQCYGKLICKFTSCDECLFCSHNENILQCRSVFVPLFLGLLTGVLVTILTMKIIKVLHKTILEKFISSLINLIHSFYKNNKSKLERQVRDTILTDIRQNYDLSFLDSSHKSDQNKLSIVWSVTLSKINDINSKLSTWSIHGLWNNTTDSNHIEFDYLSVKFIINISVLWRSLRPDTTKKELWEHEWSKHGDNFDVLKCEDYFIKGISLFEKFNDTSILETLGITPSNEKIESFEFLNKFKYYYKIYPQIEVVEDMLYQIIIHLDNNFIPIVAPINHNIKHFVYPPAQ